MQGKARELDMVQARRREEGLDETDRMIVAELQENARISNVELAKRVNLSPTPCYERVRKLERTGVVLGYQARVDRGVLGFRQTAYATITVKGNDKADLGDLITKLSSNQQVLEVAEIAGQPKLRMKVLGQSVGSISDLLKSQLSSHPAVGSYETEFVANAHIDRL